MSFPPLLGLATLLVSAETRGATTINSTPGVLDASSITRQFTFTAPNFGPGELITGVTIQIAFAKHDGESYQAPGSTPPGGTPFFDEIGFVLTSPLGTNVALISPGNFSPGSSYFMGSILFDDSAALAVNYSPSTLTSGTFKPASNFLAGFVGENPVGTWTLSITDSVGGDALSFHSATLNINEGSVSAVPEPASIVSLGCLLSASMLLRNRRR